MYHKFNTLRNSMLIAMPNLDDDYFAESVILLCEHDENGAMGLIVNRPLDLNVSEVLQEMKIANHNPELKKVPVLSGGPVKSDKGFVLHFTDELDDELEQEDENSQIWNSTLVLNEHLAITTSNDIIHALANNEHPEPFIFALGYCEWEAGQLEEEIVHNDWLVAPLDLEILFHVPHMHRWRECTYNIGINEIHNLSTYSGNA